ncbi:hypothetical protein C8Q76DRAFT_13533 [Earliella scabrosa]|nr:hypothetical protein C8Q76DRAFT_13533 [Earliella scabrosa]
MWLARYVTVALQTTNPPRGIVALPVEILQYILTFLPKSSDVLHFAMTCHQYHEISTPYLYRVVTLTQSNLSAFFEKIASHDPRLALVQHLKLFNAPDVLSDGKIFVTMRNLKSLTAAFPAVMHGWQTFLHVISCLPTTLVEFSGVIFKIEDTNATLSSPVVLPAMRSLTLAISDEWRSLHSNNPLVPPALSHNFPNLTSMTLSCLLLPRAALLAQSHFPSLSAFRLDALRPWDVRERIEGVMAFLSHHASTLSELRLPPCAEENAHDPQREEALFTSLALKLHKLQCCPHFARMLARTQNLSQLSKLGIVHPPQGQPPPVHLLGGNDNTGIKPFSAVTVLALSYATDDLGAGDLSSWLAGLSTLFPALVAVHIHPVRTTSPSGLRNAAC